MGAELAAVGLGAGVAAGDEPVKKCVIRAMLGVALAHPEREISASESKPAISQMAG